MSGPRLVSPERAVDRLTEALAQPETSMNRDASMQRFEFCFELAWKAIQECLREEGADCQSPKSCLREAYRLEWLMDETGWIAMLDDRNLTAHTYDETFARTFTNVWPGI